MLTLKPSIINALFPIFLRNLFFSFITILILFGILQVLVFFNVIILTASEILIWSVALLILFAIAPLAVRIFILYNTRYYFLKTHVISEFKFIVIKKYSVSYERVSNVTVDISVWDRITRAGDITLHTAEDVKQDLVLRYIKNPREMEKTVYNMIDFQKHRPHHEHHKEHHRKA